MSLAARILGREVLTLDEFADAVVARLAWEHPGAVATRPRPGLLAVARGRGRPVEFPLQSHYRAYQADTRALQPIVARFVEWVAAATRRA